MYRIRILVASLVVLMAAETVAAQTRRAIQFPDLPDRQTLICDFHMHTVFSDGLVWPTVRVDEAWREGLDVIAITDHIEYLPHKKDVVKDHNRSYEVAAGRARERDIILIRGSEITRSTPPGHFNTIFMKDCSVLDVKDFYIPFEKAAEQGAFAFWNHPLWKGLEKGQWAEAQETLYQKGQLQGVEVCNEDDYYPEVHTWAIEKNLTMLGNSDIHAPSRSLEPTPEKHRTLTLVFVSERTKEAVREALFERRTAVWFENRVIGRERELAALFEASVEVLPPHHRDGKRAWLKIENRCELDIKLERVGKAGPSKLTLPAKATTLVRLSKSIVEKGEPLKYRATNFLLAPDTGLEVQLSVPAE